MIIDHEKLSIVAKKIVLVMEENGVNAIEAAYLLSAGTFTAINDVKKLIQDLKPKNMDALLLDFTEVQEAMERMATKLDNANGTVEE